MRVNVLVIYKIPINMTDTKGNSYAKYSIFKSTISTLSTLSTIESYQVITTHIGVLPCDKEGNVQKKNRGKSDDSFYQQHPELHKKYPRAYSRTKIMNGDQVVKEVITRGFFKFSGVQTGDEDDSDAMCTSLVPDDLENKYDRVLWTDKLNGKTVVMTSFELEGKFYLLGGSKGVHRIISLDEPIKSLDKLDVNSQKFVKPIFKIFLEQLSNLTKENRTTLLDSLQKGETLCGEYEDGKHIVWTDEPTIKWFGIVNSSEGFEEEDTSLTGDIVTNLQYLRNIIELPTPNFELLSKEEDKERSPGLRHEKDTEGMVKHFINQNDTVFVQKIKTDWYVLIRILRQIILNGTYFFAGTCKNRLLDRNKFLKLENKKLLFWYDRFILFGKWFKSKGYDKTVVGIDNDSRGMSVVWKEFLEDPANAIIPFTQHLYPSSYENLVDMNLHELYSDRLLVVMQGIPGIGKSTLAELVTRKYGHKCVTIEQDQFDGNTKLCQAKLKEYLADDYEVIILSRNNANESQVKRYILLASEANWKVLVITPSELSTRPEMRHRLVEICEETVLERTGHPTFDKLKKEDRKKIVHSFNNQFQPLHISQHIHLIEEMDYLRLNGKRRNLIQMRDQLYRLIRKNLTATPEPLYIALLVNDKDLLKRKIKINIKNLVENKVNEKETKEYLHHLTLMHSHGLRNNRVLWDRLKNLRHEPFTVHVQSIVTQGLNIVLKCSLMDLDHIVLSGYPHITGYITKDESPYISVSILKNLSIKDKDKDKDKDTVPDIEDIDEIVLEPEIVLKDMKLELLF
jgi:hypothetical protein